jgi:hypothetical protein
VDEKKEMRKNFLLKFRINPASIKFDMKLFNYWFLWRIIRHPDTITNGITNRCDDKLHYVLFFDFDNIYYDTVREQLLALQMQEKMSNIIILTTGEKIDDYGKTVGSYHAYELTHRLYHELPEILKYTSVDRNTLRAQRLFSGKGWVLRTEPKILISSGKMLKDKPKFKEVLWSHYKQKGKKHSFAHYYYGTRLGQVYTDTENTIHDYEQTMEEQVG